MQNRSSAVLEFSKKFVIFSCVFSFLFAEVSENALARSEYISINLLKQKPKKSAAKQKGKAKSAAKTKKASGGKKATVKGKKGKKAKVLKRGKKETRRERARRLKSLRSGASRQAVKRVLPSSIEIYETLRDTLLAPDVQYRHLIMGRERHSVHVVKTNITNPAYSLQILKGADRVDGMERLVDMVAGHDSTTKSTVLAAVNANFWSMRALPIGPTVIDGEVVQISSHKQWSSAFFTPEGQMFIDAFKMKGQVSDTRGRSYSLSEVNYRTDSTGLVLYNAFAGDTIPYVNSLSIDRQIEEMERNRVETEGDSTEAEISPEELRRELMAARRAKNIESSMTKIQLRYLRSPVVNGKIACEILNIGEGDMKMPVRGCILSLGKNFPMVSFPHEGDTLFLNFTTNYYKNVEFTNAVSGTPRMVRHGVGGHEAYSEGSTAKRFIMNNLARTAIGRDESGENMYIVAIEPTGRQEDCVGATLSQEAEILEYLGLFDAMNLDGGGSTTMAIGQEIVTHRNTTAIPRKLSVGVAIVKKALRKRS